MMNLTARNLIAGAALSLSSLGIGCTSAKPNSLEPGTTNGVWEPNISEAISTKRIADTNENIVLQNEKIVEQLTRIADSLEKLSPPKRPAGE